MLSPLVFCANNLNNLSSSLSPFRYTENKRDHSWKAQVKHGLVLPQLHSIYNTKKAKWRVTAHSVKLHRWGDSVSILSFLLRNGRLGGTLTAQRRTPLHVSLWKSVVSNENSPFWGQNFLLKTIEYLKTEGFYWCTLITALSDTKCWDFSPFFCCHLPLLKVYFQHYLHDGVTFSLGCTENKVAGIGTFSVVGTWVYKQQHKPLWGTVSLAGKFILQCYRMYTSCGILRLEKERTKQNCALGN